MKCVNSLSVLWSAIEGDADAYGLYLQPSGAPGAGPSPAPQRQAGVFRINCIDCLDRTNVVQVRVLAAKVALRSTSPSCFTRRLKCVVALHPAACLCQHSEAT